MFGCGDSWIFCGFLGEMLSSEVSFMGFEEGISLLCFTKGCDLRATPTGAAPMIEG